MAMNDTVHSVKHLVQPRSSQACQRCRSLKARCLASDRPGTCKRCLNSKRDCIWPEAQQRARPQRGPSRWSQVEKKIDDLAAHIAENGPPKQAGSSEGGAARITTSTVVRRRAEQGYASPASTEGQRTDNNDIEEDDHENDLREIAAIHDFESDSNDVGLEDELTAAQHEPRNNDRLAQSILAEPEAEGLLEQYRTMAISFPFVPVDSNANVQQMSKRKPMLMLAIMTVASFKNRKLQSSLEKQYRRELADRTIINPRKTIDLLQSILVYQAWYHYHVDPKFENWSIFQIAFGLTAELKLEPQFIPQMLPGRDRTKRIRGGKDGQRALLGCYYLSSIVASGLQTPNCLKLSPYMFECKVRLENDCELDSDKILASMVDAQYLENQIYDFYHPYPVHSVQPTREHMITQLGIWETHIYEWKKMAEVRDESYDIKLLYYGLEMELYHSVYRHLCKNESSSQSTLGLTKVNVLSSCLEAGRSFLDTLMSVSLEEFRIMSWPIWLRLPRVLITVAMLTAPSEHHSLQWNLKAAQDRVRLDLFLESLCFRMQSLTTFNPPSQPAPDFWLAMKTALQSVARWYKRIMSRGKSESLSASTIQSTPRTETAGQLNELQFSHSANTYDHTPESAAATMFEYTDPSWQAQSFLPPIACPMMKAGANPGIDQFIDMGFWGDAFSGLDTNYDFTM